jgi:hypothetical protein
MALRDNHFEVTWNYNYGDDYWSIAHDGKAWNIDHHLRPSQNQFKKLDEAVYELKQILKAENETKSEQPISD